MILNETAVKLESNIVNKSYRNTIAQSNEKFILLNSSEQSPTPSIISCYKNSIILKYIEGTDFVTLLEDVSANKSLLSETIGYFEQLFLWLIHFQEHFKKITNQNIVLQDFNLHNFIFNKETNSVMGINFTHWHYGEAEENFSALLTNLLSCNLTDSFMVNAIYRHIYELLMHDKRFCIDLIKKNLTKQRYLLELHRNTKKLLANSTAVVLTGGKSRRMDYFPKSLLILYGHTFMDHILYQLDCFNNIILSVDGTEKYKHYGLQMICDNYKNIGPLAGIEASIACAKTDLVFFTPCDTPFINNQLIFYMYSQMSDKDDCIIPVIEGKMHPLFGIYRTSLLTLIRTLIAQNDYKVKILLDKINTHYVEIDKSFTKAFVNINYVSEYKALTS